jgi:two-component system, OmpR family, sensor kinase
VELTVPLDGQQAQRKPFWHWNTMPIRRKLTLLYAGVLVFVAIIIGSSATITVYFTLINSIDDSLAETATFVLQNSRSYAITQFGGERRISISIPELDKFQNSGLYVQVWQTWDGAQNISPEFAAASSNLGDYRAPLDVSAVDSQTETYTINEIDGVPYRILTRPIVLIQGVQFGNVQVAASIGTLNQAINRLVTIMVIGGVVSMMMLVAVGLLIARRILQPIEDITLAAASIADNEDLATRLAWVGPRDELGQLAAVFNHMMERLEHLFSVQQRFVADVSHELRTPLTAIRGNVEIIKRYGMDQDSLDAIESETGRMARLVNDLLMLARADYGEIKVALMPIDLDTIMSEVYREAKVLVKDRNLKVAIEQFAPLRINGNADRLKQVVLNLVGNAIKFTADGGKITLNLYERDSKAVIEVVDTGIGIAPKDLERIFHRFYQADESRARSGEAGGGGAGLGLSIVKWLVEAHQGTVRATSELGKGTIFTIQIPLLDAPARPTKAQNNKTTHRRLPIAFNRAEEKSREG